MLYQIKSIKLNLVIGDWSQGWSISIGQYDKSTLVQVIAQSRHAPGHHQCWPRSMVPYGTTNELRSMMTSPHGNIFRVTGPLCGEFTGLWWIPLTRAIVTRSFDVFFDLRLNKQLSKQWWGWWFATPSPALWRHCNDWHWTWSTTICQSAY